jgi:hypothetical protein
MDELIKALTRAATAVAVYYEKATAGHAAEQIDKAAEKVAVDKPTGKKEKAAAKKADAAPSAPTASEDEKKASLEKLREKAKAFVQRAANQQEGIAAYKAVMKETCGADKMDDLTHEQRLTLIPVLEEKLKTPEAKIASAAKSGVEV